MKRIVNGLIFGNKKSECKKEILTQLLTFCKSVIFLKLKKIRNKDMFEYMIIVEL